MMTNPNERQYQADTLLAQWYRRKQSIVRQIISALLGRRED